MDSRQKHDATPSQRPARASRVRPERGQRPDSTRRRRLAVLLVALIVAVAGGLYWYLTYFGNGSVRLAQPPEDGAAGIVSFAGFFPPENQPALRNPLGIAVIGRRVFVAESDAGTIREFGEDGRRVGVIALPRASGAATAYPADIAAIDAGRLAVVDSASSRVLLLSVAGARAPIVVGAGDRVTAPKQPTAVARVSDGIAVADAKDRAIKVYDASGSYLRTIGETLKPRLGFVGGMAIVGETLRVADSNAGRVLELDPETGALVGIHPETLDLPRGIAAAGADRMVVAETFKPGFLLVGPGGAVLTSVTAGSEQLEPLARPVLPKAAAWMAETRRLYVTDAGDGRIRVYNVADTKGK